MDRVRKPFDESKFLEACRKNGIEFNQLNKDCKNEKVRLKDENGCVLEADSSFNIFREPCKSLESQLLIGKIVFQYNAKIKKTSDDLLKSYLGKIKSVVLKGALIAPLQSSYTPRPQQKEEYKPLYDSNQLVS